MTKNPFNLRPSIFIAIFVSTCCLTLATELSAQDTNNSKPEVAKPQLKTRKAPVAIAETVDALKTTEVSPERAEKFAQYMSGAKLKGQFTVLGMKDKMPEETYTISKCEKLPEGDLYRFTARIQYGETDTELPMDLPVVWAGDTPVITLTNMWLPGLGTFSSRVLIYKDSYAGTWQHDEVGGHLFGVIEKDEIAVADPAGESKE